METPPPSTFSATLAPQLPTRFTNQPKQRHVSESRNSGREAATFGRDDGCPLGPRVL